MTKDKDQCHCVICGKRRIREIRDNRKSSLSPPCYLRGSMPDDWGLRRHVAGQIVVTHKDGSGVLIREDSESIAESLFYRMMDQILLAK